MVNGDLTSSSMIKGHLRKWQTRAKGTLKGMHRHLHLLVQCRVLSSSSSSRSMDNLKGLSAWHQSAWQEEDSQTNDAPYANQVKLSTFPVRSLLQSFSGHALVSYAMSLNQALSQSCINWSHVVAYSFQQITAAYQCFIPLALHSLFPCHCRRLLKHRLMPAWTYPAAPLKEDTVKHCLPRQQVCISSGWRSPKVPTPFVCPPLYSHPFVCTPLPRPSPLLWAKSRCCRAVIQ